MSSESFRFIHAGDFHLENPLGDLDVYPNTIQSAIVDAPRTAVKAIFDAALAENIDFLVLSGNLLSPAAAGPHGMSLIIDGLQRLADRDKPVFWTTGVSDDSAKWPDAIPLPPNVHLFSKTAAELIPVQRAGRTICTVTGRSSDGRNSLAPSTFSVEATDHFSIAVGCGQVEKSSIAATDFDHWCLGGKPSHQSLELAEPQTAAYCGSPQSRSVSHTGPHGYVVVDVDADQTRRIHQVACDVFRYANETINAAAVAASGSLKNLLGSAIARLQSEAGGRHLIIRFEIQISDGDDMALVGSVDDVLESMRRDHGGGNPSTWTAAIDVTGPSAFPKAWKEEDTILGDFLRAAEAVRDAASPIALQPLTEEQSLPETVATQLATPKQSRLDEATLLGVRMLRGEKV